MTNGQNRGQHPFPFLFKKQFSGIDRHITEFVWLSVAPLPTDICCPATLANCKETWVSHSSISPASVSQPLLPSEADPFLSLKTQPLAASILPLPICVNIFLAQLLPTAKPWSRQDVY